jgi:hypothetical protein
MSKTASHPAVGLSTILGCILFSAALAVGQSGTPPARTRAEQDESEAASDVTTEGAVERTDDPAPASPAITASGFVVSPDGRPVAGANVVLRSKIGGTQYWFGVRHNRDRN